jgi:two-component system sensor histidine kinase/response regulator
MAVAGTTPWTFVLDEPTRILVVDDDPILREFATVHLASPSATIETTCDGVAARQLLDQSAYDVLLLDIEMPGLDGFSLLKEIRSSENLRDLPVIMLTVHDDVASIDRSYHLGANSFATKPVNWRQLSYQIRSILRANRANGTAGRNQAHPRNEATAHIGTPKTEPEYPRLGDILVVE